MSKVVKFYEFGSPDVLKLEEEPLRKPQAEEVRIQVQALGLNRAEVLYRTNVYTVVVAMIKIWFASLPLSELTFRG
jgi:NADPH:quinone reductase-like Zn-dependent oxidoreductase